MPKFFNCKGPRSASDYLTSLAPTENQQQAMIWLMDSMTIRAATILLVGGAAEKGASRVCQQHTEILYMEEKGARTF